jgi:hypothetical protein
MARTKTERRRKFSGRVVRPNTRSGWLYELFPDFSWPAVGLTILISALGLGPLLAISVFELEGLSLKLMAALGPVLVCAAFAIASYVYGKRAQMEAFALWMIVGMFVVLGLIAGVALFFSV